MNIRLLFSVLILSSTFSSLYAKSEKLKGYYITLSDDTIFTKINVPLVEGLNPLTNEVFYRPNISSIRKSVTCYGENGVKVVVTSEQVKELVFTYGNEEYQLLARKVNKTLVFLKLEKDGQMKMFACISKTPIARGTGVQGVPAYYVEEDEFILQKGNGETFQPHPVFFADEMSKYLSDYPELAAKIAQRNYKLQDIYMIVGSYNNWWVTQYGGK